MADGLLQNGTLCHVGLSFLPMSHVRALSTLRGFLRAIVSFWRGVFRGFLCNEAEIHTVCYSSVPNSFAEQTYLNTPERRILSVQSASVSSRIFSDCIRDFASLLRAGNVRFLRLFCILQSRTSGKSGSLQKHWGIVCKSEASQSRIEPFSVPRVAGSIYGRASEIARCQPPTQSAFQTTYAKESRIPGKANGAIGHSCLFPNRRLHHVPFPLAFMPTTAFAGARSGIDAAVFTRSGHSSFSLNWSMIRRTTSAIVMPKRLASFLRNSNWGFVSATDLRTVLMNTLLAPLSGGVKC